MRYSKLKLIKVTRSEHQENPPELKQIEGKETPVKYTIKKPEPVIFLTILLERFEISVTRNYIRVMFVSLLCQYNGRHTPSSCAACSCGHYCWQIQGGNSGGQHCHSHQRTCSASQKKTKSVTFTGLPILATIILV
jgi:hypothetical protein